MKRTRLLWIIVGVILICVAAAALLLLFKKQWLTTTYNRIKIERTVSAELKPLTPVLQSLGFTNLKDLKTSCGYETYDTPTSFEDSIYPDGGTYFNCSSGVNEFIKVPTTESGKANFNRSAAELSKVLIANGWVSRQDYPTIPWFEKITQGVDYQPDQLNRKTVDGMDCMVDFFTSFSRPDPAAITLTMSCAMPSVKQ